LATVTANNQRIAELEKQLDDAVKEVKSASVDQLAVLSIKDSRIAELERLLADAVNDKSAVVVLKNDRITELEEYLSSTQSQMAILIEENNALMEAKTLLLKEKNMLMEEKTVLTEHTLAKDERVGGMNMTVSQSVCLSIVTFVFVCLLIKIGHYFVSVNHRIVSTAALIQALSLTHPPTLQPH